MSCLAFRNCGSNLLSVNRILITSFDLDLRTCFTNCKPIHNFQPKLCLELSNRFSHSINYSLFEPKVLINCITMRLMVSKEEIKCWKCSKALSTDTVFCSNCKTLQAIDKNLDFFQIIGLNRSYNIEPTILKQKYRTLQALLHPDKFSSKSKEEQELSEEFSSVVNKAYSTLLDPLERGLYLLSLHNTTVNEDTTDMDKLFLMEIMDRNEEIENETDPLKLKEFYANNKEQLNHYIRKIVEAFEANDIQLAKELLTKMKYYNSIDGKIKEIKQKLNIPD